MQPTSRSHGLNTRLTSAAAAPVMPPRFLSVVLTLLAVLAHAAPASAATITFQTEPGRPRIVSTMPAHRALSVLTNTHINVTFSDDMDVSTLTSTNIKLLDMATGELVPAWTSAALTTTPTSVSATQNLYLDSQTSYALILTTGVKSYNAKTLDPADPLHRTGTLFGEGWVVEFATGNALSGATVQRTNIGNLLGGPTGGQTNVPVNAIINVYFDRAMSGATISNTTVQLKKSGTSTPLSVAVVYDTIASAVVVTPTTPLEYGTNYTLTLIGLRDILGDMLP